LVEWLNNAIANTEDALKQMQLIQLRSQQK
jgi:hypothetical protein